MAWPAGIRVAVVVAMIALAGCSGIAGEAATSDREPYGVDEPIDPDSSAPGIDGIGHSDLDEWHDIWLAHVGVLERESYERVVETTVRDDNGSVVREEVSRTVVAADGSLLYEFERTAVDGEANHTVRTEHWVGEELSILQRTDGESTTVETMPRPSDPASTFPVQPQSMFASVNESADVERSDGSHVVVSGAGDVAPYHNVTFAASINEAGYVEGLGLEGEQLESGQSVEITMRIDGVDEAVALEAPTWVDEVDSDE